METQITPDPMDIATMDGTDLLRGGLLAMILASTVGAAEPIAESKGSFTSGGKPIGIETFAPEPKVEGKRPAVVMLHGAGGLAAIGGGEAMRAVARVVAARGYVVVMVHYFDRTDTKFADEPTIKREFATWMRTVGDAVGHVSGLPGVDAERVGLVGFSLGAYLSLAEATYDPRVKGIVEFFGGLPEAMADRAGSMPPTLILHGDADKIVPVQQARDLERILKAKKVTYDMHIYEGAGHGFFGADGIDCVQRTVAFLDKHVRGA